jgi:hypothetical protein
MHVNKVHHVTTINRVAKDLGENEDWLFDVANEMDVEDGGRDMGLRGRRRRRVSLHRLRNRESHQSHQNP